MISAITALVSCTYSTATSGSGPPAVMVMWVVPVKVVRAFRAVWVAAGRGSQVGVSSRATTSKLLDCKNSFHADRELTVLYFSQYRTKPPFMVYAYSLFSSKSPCVSGGYKSTK